MSRSDEDHRFGALGVADLQVNRIQAAELCDDVQKVVDLAVAGGGLELGADFIQDRV